MPNSTNSWDQTIIPDNTVLPPEIMSGNLVFKSQFFDKDTLLGTAIARIYYV